MISKLRDGLLAEKEVIWVHAASLGEFEQGLPVLESLKSTFPQYQIVLTFFSPSGYEVRKNNPVADIVSYLPLDSSWNAKNFIKAVNPKLTIFIKYEVWPNYLKVLKEKSIPVILISAIFSRRQIYFKSYGSFMRRSLKYFTHIFVQNEDSKKRLKEIGIENVTVSGDTRFDRVAKIRERDNQLEFMERFSNELPCLVAGSTWPEDEELLLDYINSEYDKMRFVLVPHDIKKPHLKQLRSRLKKTTVLFSEKDQADLSSNPVLIIDTVGLLTKIYSYADIAYVGGGFATGLHNTLEPAVFGIPVVIGPEYQNFQEALDLVHEKGILVVRNSDELKSTLNQLVEDEDFRLHTGLINSNYINRKRGASIQIMDHLRRLL